MINIILGLMNSGKTLYMTYCLYKAWLKGKTIIANYDLYFPKTSFNNKIYKINSDTLKLWASEGKVLKNTAFGLDEFWLFADSRTAIQNTAVTYFFNQSSKDDMEIYLTSQHNGQLDTRLRNNCHKLTQCSRVILNDFGIFCSLDEEQRFLNTVMKERLYIKAVDFKRINRGFVSNIEIGETKYIKADKVFNLYDTTQKIKKVVI